MAVASQNRAAWRNALVVVSAVFAIAQFIDAFFIETPIVGIAFAVIVGLLALLVWRSASWIPVALLLVLAVLELLMVLFVYPNAPSAPPLWRLVLFAVLSIGTAALAVLTLAARR